MTSSGRLFVPLLFIFCLPALHNNGRGPPRPCRPRVGRRRVRATLSLDAGKAQPPSGRRRAGKRAMAVTAAAGAVMVLTAGVLTACGSSPGSPPSGASLARMCSGKISRWDDPAIAALNPAVKLSGTAVVPVHRADSSGSTFLFTSYLNAQDPADWSSSLIGTTVAWPRKAGALGA